MPDSTGHGWYEITKDLIIPALEVLATIVIGIIVAGLLRRKEEKAKIKSLLVDTYMSYLNKRANQVRLETQEFTLWIYNEILADFQEFFGRDANWHNPFEIMKKRKEEFNKQIKSIHNDDVDWSPFTYKFCFLLGTKMYRKHAQKLEDTITNSFLAVVPRKKFIEELKTEIRNNPDYKNGIYSSNQYKIESALDAMEMQIAAKYNDFQFRVFNAYDNKIADLIDAY